MSHASSEDDDISDGATFEDVDCSGGQMLFLGWDGSEVTSQVRRLIQEFKVGAILLTAKYLKSAEHATKLIQELQHLAYSARHTQPLLIAIDQECGGVNSLFDEELVCDFPSAMGVASAGSVDLMYDINKASADAAKACGINMILGPVLDVLLNSGYQPLGVRSVGDEPYEVSNYGIAAINGIKDAGLAACGKHFPSTGSLDFLGSSLDMPVITQTMEELYSSALVPFRNAIAAGRLESIMVSGCGLSNPSMNIPHACLSSQIVDDLLRQELGFNNGVVISECLEIEALSHDIGIQSGVAMAVEAGCDLVMLCRSFDIQLQALQGLELGVSSGLISRERISESVARINHLKKSCTSWQTALHPPGLSLLSTLRPSHAALSRAAYDKSIAVVRDRDGLIPLSQSMMHEEELLLLTPLVKPLPAMSLARAILRSREPQPSSQAHNDCAVLGEATAAGDEGVFRELGRALARARRAKLLHTSYTANGVRPVHENLIRRASTVIIVTANASRNLYQASFAKHVDLLCSTLRMQGQRSSVIVIAVSSPYDFVLDKTIGTYLCTFDFTENAMQALVRVLWGESVAQGSLPGSLRPGKKAAPLKSRRIWIVEPYERGRDALYLARLMHSLSQTSSSSLKVLGSAAATTFFDLTDTQMKEAHFVVRNSSTNVLYGFAATYSIKDTGIIAAIFVNSAKRNLSIGRSLYRRCVMHLKNTPGVSKIQIGSSFPGVFLGIPLEDGSIMKWFTRMGWSTRSSRRLSNLVIDNINSWDMPEDVVQDIKRANITFDLVQDAAQPESDALMALVERHASPDVAELYTFALRGSKSCGIVRARDASGAVVGTAILCAPRSPAASFIPALASTEGDIGGIVSPLTYQTSNSSLILQALVLMGIRQNKAHKARKTALISVSDESSSSLLQLGFSVGQSFEQMTSAAGSISTVS